MKLIWFKRSGWIYQPVSFAGWSITLLTFAMCAWFFIVIDRHSHSVSDTLIGFFPYGVCFWVVTFWIASNTVENNNQV
jgi:hypothetical protein